VERTRNLQAAFFVLLLTSLWTSLASAQLYTGSITGIVTDPSGAVVPSAKITVVDQDKGYSFSVTANGSGRYLVRPVPPGNYKISVEAAGFQGEYKENVRVDVTQNVSIDFAMAIRVGTESIEVTSHNLQLQTEDAVTGQVVNRRFVNDLPLVTRQFTDLAFLAPGITETTEPGTRGVINFNSNGSRNSTADVLIDGASASNFEQNSGIHSVPYTPSVDSVEEFKVQQSNFSAEYGFAGGTIINVVTRSGENHFHGSGYEFLRNAATDANTWFNNHSGTPRPGFKRHNFGATLGGPIRKDKTFFFVDYEGTRENTSNSSGRIGVPTLCERGDAAGVDCGPGGSALGNFGEICTAQDDGTGNGNAHFDSSGQCVDSNNQPFYSGQLYDPYSGVFSNSPTDPFGNGLSAGAVRSTFIPFDNLATFVSTGNPKLVGTPFQPVAGVPGNLIDPVARKLLLLFPKPNQPGSDLSTLQNLNFSSSGVDTNSSNQFDIKIDHRFSDRNLLSVRYSQQNASSTSFNCFGNFVDPCTGGPANISRHEASINHTHTFSPSLVLTLTYGYLRAFDNAPGIKGQFPNIDSSFNDLGIPSYLNNGRGTIPAISISGYGSTNGTNIGTQPFSITREGQDAHHLSGSLSWLRGKHELKFGGEGRLHRINHANPGWPSGFFAFDSSSTSLISTEGDTTSNGFPVLGGDGLASFLTGVGQPTLAGGSGCTPCQLGFNDAVSTQSFRYGVFVQDNYKVSQKLTVNLGLRYELSLPRTERFNRMDWLDPNAISPLQPTPVNGLPSTPLHGIEVFVGGNHRSNYDTDYKAIQPRFGFAYQLHPSVVLRGGYGIYFSTPRSGASGTGPWGFQGYEIEPPWLTTLNIDHATPYNTLSNTSCQFTPPYTCGVAPPPGNSLGAFNDIGGAAVGPIPSTSRNIPYEQAWSFGFQKEFPGNLILDTNYVGKKGTHLYLGGFRNLNYLPASAIQGMSPTDIGNLNDLVANPFYFDPTQFPAGTVCDHTKFICDPGAGALAQSQVQAFQLLVPFPQYSAFQGDSPPIANSIYHALQVRLEKSFSHGLQFLVTYAWAKSIDNASATDDSISFLGGGSEGNTINVQNPFDLRAERAVSLYDIPHTIQASFDYELPFGRGRALGRNMNSVLNSVIGGWQVNGVVRADNGRPIVPVLAGGNPIPTYGQRANLSGALRRASGSPERFVDSGNYFANPEVLTIPDDFTFGNAPRSITSVRQPGARDTSLSIFKEFALSKLKEGARLEFRAESFNTFNHPVFRGPDSNVGSSTFGLINATANSPRELQLALKLYF